MMKRFWGMLDVEPEEEGPVSLLLAISFFMGLFMATVAVAQTLAPVLERVLALASAGEYTRLFLDEGEPMRRLLAEFVRSPASNELAQARARRVRHTPDQGPQQRASC